MCWTKSRLRSNASVAGACRDSQVVGYEGVRARVTVPFHDKLL
eukprot:SAG31_NODE_12164_length_962_cov_1.304751_1_plen_42_part_01